jgi:signal transduction histidine kinase
MGHVSDQHYYILIITLLNSLFSIVLKKRLKIKEFKYLTSYWSYFFFIYLCQLYSLKITYMGFIILIPLAIIFRKSFQKKHKLLASVIITLLIMGTFFSSLKDQSFALIYFYLCSTLPPLFVVYSHLNNHLEKEKRANDLILRKLIHDLGNPLSVIQGYVDMIKSGRIPPSKFESTLDKMKAGCKAIQNNLSKEKLDQVKETIEDRS